MNFSPTNWSSSRRCVNSIPVDSADNAVKRLVPSPVAAFNGLDVSRPGEGFSETDVDWEREISQKSSNTSKQSNATGNKLFMIHPIREPGAPLQAPGTGDDLDGETCANSVHGRRNHNATSSHDQRQFRFTALAVFLDTVRCVVVQTQDDHVANNDCSVTARPPIRWSLKRLILAHTPRGACGSEC